MNRAEAYAEGYDAGRLWAQEDISARSRLEPVKLHRLAPYMSDESRAEQLGYMRGYRDTWARWDAGALTWEMLEHAPLGR